MCDLALRILMYSLLKVLAMGSRDLPCLLILNGELFNNHPDVSAYN